MGIRRWAALWVVSFALAGCLAGCGAEVAADADRPNADESGESDHADRADPPDASDAPDLPDGSAAQDPDPAETPPDAPMTTAVVDSSAETTRTVRAYEGSDGAIRVFSVSFPAKKGEKRLVTAKILAKQASTTPDELLMAAVSVSCSPKGPPRSSASATQNTLRGTTTTLTPRFVHTAPSDGMVACIVTAVGSRPRPVASGSVTSNVWTVASGSSLTASAPIPSWSRHLISGAASRVLDAGTSWTPIEATVSVAPGVTSFRVLSDHKVTTCSAVGGSSDSTTGGKNLCEGRKNPIGTRVELTVTARQRTAAGAWCGPTQTITKLTETVTVDEHHEMLFGEGTAKVDPTCAPTFVIGGRIAVVSGADLVVHAPTESTSIVP